MKVKVGSDDATFLLRTRDSVPMEHCSTQWFQQCLIAPVSQVSPSQLSDIVGSTCNTLGQRGPMLHEDTVPCPKD